MGNNLYSLFIVCFVGFLYADTLIVGDKNLNIPSPDMFSQGTEEMDGVYRLFQQSVDPMNDQLAYYIAESEIPKAMTGELPNLNRYFIIKVSKKLKNILINTRDFTKLKTETKEQNSKIINSVKKDIPNLMKKTSEGVSKEFDVNIALKLNKVVPLDFHYETENAFSYSMYINYGVEAQGSKNVNIVSLTTTFANISGKIIYLYCYGSKNDLEWTRSASKAWVESIISNNSTPPSQTSGTINFNKVFEKGLSGAIAGGLIALVVGILSKLKRKPRSGA